MSGSGRTDKSGGAGNPANKLAEVQKQADVVIDVMRKNIESAIERQGRLEELDDKSQQLIDHAEDFKRGATAVKRQQMCKYFKLTLLIVLILVVAIIVILAAAGVFG